MKCRSIWRVEIAVILVMAMSGLTAVLAGDLSVNIEASYERPGGEFSDRYGSELGPSIGVEYMYNPYLGFTSSVAYHNFDRSEDGRDLSVMHFILDGQVAYPFLDKWRVFTQFGMGLYAWDADNAWWIDGHPDEGADFGYNFGAGVNYRILDYMDITTSVIYHDVEFKGNSRSFHWTEFKTGVRFLLDFSSN